MTNTRKSFSSMMAAATLLALGTSSRPSAAADPLTDLRSDDPTLRIQATKTLAGQAQVAPTAIPLLAEALNDLYWDVRVNAVQALAKAGPSALPHILKALQRPDYHAPIYAARVLAQMGAAANQTDLAMQLLRNTQLPGPDRARQLHAAWALSQVQCTEPVLWEPLAQAYKDCTDDEISHYLALAASRFGPAAKGLAAEAVTRLDTDILRAIGPSAVELLLQDSEKSQARRVFAIYTVLGQLGSVAEPALPVLLREINAPRDPWFGARATQAVGDIGIFNQEVVTALEKATQSSSKEVAEAATAALAKRKK